jgi:aminopeptidase N
VQTSVAGGEATITVQQKNNPSDKLFPCVVEVEIAGATTTARVSVPFGVASQSLTETATVPFSEPITAVTVDPDRRLIGWSAGTPPILVKRPVWIF